MSGGMMINFNPNLLPDDQPDDELCQQNGFEDAVDYQQSKTEVDSFDEFLISLGGETEIMRGEFIEINKTP